MSIMRCFRCEKYIDTDLNTFDFDTNLCIDCWYKVLDESDLQSYRRLEDDNIPPDKM